MKHFVPLTAALLFGNVDIPNSSNTPPEPLVLANAARHNALVDKAAECQAKSTRPLEREECAERLLKAFRDATEQQRTAISGTMMNPIQQNTPPTK